MMKAQSIVRGLILAGLAGTASAQSSLSSTPAGQLWGDLDGDGRKDLVVFDRSGSKLFRNLGAGRFDDVTDLALPPGVPPALAGVLNDYDRDGWLDLFLIHAGGFTLYRNTGQAVFADATERAGLEGNLPGRSVHLEDYDADGYDDLMVRSPRRQRLYHNLRNGCFEEVVLPGLGIAPGPANVQSSPSGDSGQPATSKNTGTLGEDSLAVGSSAADRSATRSARRKGAPPTASRGGAPGAGSAIGGGGSRSAAATSGMINGTLLPPHLSATGSTVPDDDWDYLSNAPHMFSIPTGNVGIGTSDPESPLSVVTDETKPTPADVSNFALFASNYLGTAGERNGLLVQAGWQSQIDEIARFSAYGTGYTEVPRMILRADGSMELNGPQHLIRLIHSDTSSAYGIEELNSSGNRVHYIGTSGPAGIFYQYDDGVEKNRIYAGGDSFFTGGKVGIGTSTPTDILHVSDGNLRVQSFNPVSTYLFPHYGAANSYRFGLGLNTHWDGSNWKSLNDGTNNGGGAIVGKYWPGAIDFYTIPTTGTSDQTFTNAEFDSFHRMRIDPAGNVGIGTAAPTEKLDVIGNARVEGNAYIREGSLDVREGTPVASVTGGRVRVGSHSTIQLNPISGGQRQLKLNVSAWYGEILFSVLDYQGITREMIFDEGKLGVGTTSPTKLLDVAGDARVRNDLTVEGTTTTEVLVITGGADLVEPFQTGQEVCEAGTVVVIDEANAGHLVGATVPYDTKVAGVVSGAGGISPGIQLSQEGVTEGDALVAMTGRVYVKCSAENGSVRPGDLLTTASLAGYAMKATDRERSFGAVIGKAMTSLDDGTGLVLVLVNLQ